MIFLASRAAGHGQQGFSMGRCHNTSPLVLKQNDTRHTARLTPGSSPSRRRLRNSFLAGKANHIVFAVAIARCTTTTPFSSASSHSMRRLPAWPHQL